MAFRAIFFSDTHLGLDYPVRPRSPRPRRGGDFFANYQRVLAYARCAGVDLVIHGGDFFFRSRVHPLIVDQAYGALLEFVDSGIPVVIVPGNHERSVMPPSLFLAHPLIHVLDQPRTLIFEARGERLLVAGFPFLQHVRSRFRAAFGACEAERVSADHRLLCLHHAVDGATVGPAGFVFHGSADVIAASELPHGFDAVLGGHIHRRQVLEYDVPVVYCGSTERTSFAELDETKGFCELTLNQGARPGIRFHDLPARPMVSFDGRAYTRTTLLLDALTRRAAHWSPDAYVRLQLSAYPSASLARAVSTLLPGPLSFSCPGPFRTEGTRAFRQSAG